MTQRISSQRFRQRKLSTKQNLAILRESEVDSLVDDEAQRHIPKVETGVEKGEEVEHHLQAVINAAAVGGAVAQQLYIPTPDAVASRVKYADLYPKGWVQPATYIRFSSTVEDCRGTQYCMTSEDEAALKALNERKPLGQQCTEDCFEEVIDFFERTAHEKQPFAAVDNPPILPYEECELAFDETISEPARKFAKEIFDYWKQQRSQRANRSLMPMLKSETNLDTDDSDPYVCFRRREVRQTRKTRGRDAQVAEKLKRLRIELEQARGLMWLVKEREHVKRDHLETDRLIFEKRLAVKESKRSLGIKGDDQDLINQRPAARPRPKIDPSSMPRGLPGMASRHHPNRSDSRSLDNSLDTLEEQLARREQDVTRSIEINKARHREWNRNYVDVTWRAITPPAEQESEPAFRAAMPDYLPTPPSSTSSQEDASVIKQHATRFAKRAHEKAAVRYATSPRVSFAGQASFRRRTGRGGRLMVDRRGLKRRANEKLDDHVAERFKYDRDSDDEDCIIPVDFYSDNAMKYRIMIDKAVPRQAAIQQATDRRNTANGPSAIAQGQQKYARQTGPPMPQRLTNGAG